MSNVKIKTRPYHSEFLILIKESLLFQIDSWELQKLVEYG